MNPMHAKGRKSVGMAVLLSALVWQAGTRSNEAGVNAWTPFGPEGATVGVLAIDPADPSTLYASTPLGLFKSTDSGSTWSARLENPYVNALAIDPETPATLYVGTGDLTFNSADVNGGIFKSTDGGGSWRAINTGLPSLSNDIPTVRALAIDPSTPTTLYAGTERGVYKSTDGGDTWAGVNNGLAGDYLRTYIDALAIDPATPATLYAATWNGVYKSTDGGGSWVASRNGLPATVITLLEMDPETPTTLYAAPPYDIQNAATPLFYKSTDGGAIWVAVDNGGLGGSTPWYVADLAFAPTTPPTLYAALSSHSGAGSRAGVYKSTDGGASWMAAAGGLSSSFVGALVIDPRNSSTLYAGTSGDGVFKSTDQESGWRPIGAGLPGRTIASLRFDPRTPTTLYACTYSLFGSVAINSKVFKSTDRGGSWELFGRGDRCPALMDPETPTTMYIPSGKGLDKSTDGGVTWRHIDIGFDRTTYPVGLTVLQMDPLTPTTLYVGAWSKPGVDRWSEGLLKSTDGGETWARFWGGGDYLTTVFTMAIDPITPSTFYLGTHQGIIKFGGTGYGCGSDLPYYFIDGLAIDPVHTSTLYTRVQSGLYKSNDACRTWSAVNNGLPSRPNPSGGRLYCFGLPAIDRENGSNLYMGTCYDGLFKSTDGGGSWSPFSPSLPHNLPAGVILDPVNPAILYAVTSAGAYTLEQRPNRRPVADAGVDRVVECAAQSGTEVTLDAGRSSDPDGDALSYAWTGPFGRVEGPNPTVTLPLGISTMTLQVSDGKTESDADEVVVEVRDTLAPTLEVSASPAVLWPPDGRLVEVAFDVAATDRCDPSPAIALLDARSSEPQGEGSAGAPIHDATIGTDDRSIFLRAERSGSSSGRSYTITYRSTDASGNVTTGAAIIKVPHDLQR